jgi:hypothetical protein
LRSIEEGDGQMKIEKLEEASHYNEIGWLHVLAKAVLLDKVSIKDGKITVKAFTEDEI